jgi:hypothetical protein
LSPVGCTPIWAVLQALCQGAIVNACGSASMLPPRISSSGFTEFTSITNSGSRNQTANRISAA